jgi:hypothetical protein
MQQLVILFVGVGVGCLQPTPHSAHSLPADSPTSQQLQQDRKPQAVKTQSDLLTMGLKTPETC